MKKRGAHRIMEMVMMVAATRGMVCREKTKRFMRIPPNSIPRAAAGRFTAPREREREVGLCAQAWGHNFLKEHWRCSITLAMPDIH